MVDSPKGGDDPAAREGGVIGPRTGFFGGRRSLRSPGEALQPDVAPPPPLSSRKKRPIVATLSGMLSFIGIAAVALVILMSLALQRINAPGPLPADKVVYIVEGTNAQAIVNQLENEGVIDSWPLMWGTLYLKRDKRPIKAGEYLFKQAASLNEVADTLVSGKPVLHSITFPEGLTSEQIVEKLREDDALMGDIPVVPAEGTLMPDTFKFARGTYRAALLHNMQVEQKKIVNEVWQHRSPDIPISSPYEMVILASIVEKETGRADERPRVAGVFVNRLIKNMPLQSDPTIVYGLVGGKGTLGRGITRAEIDERTPYNTYVIPGLPPGPICNPGRAAMEAVANPSRTKEIYFVADGTGGHAFAETLDQHRVNVARWRQIEKDAHDKAVPDADKAPALAPAGPAPAKPDQRGALAPAVPVYGALKLGFPRVARAQQQPLPQLGIAAYPLAIGGDDQVLKRVKPMLVDNPAAAAPGEGDGALASRDGPALSAEEAPVDAAPTHGSLMTFPVSAARRADEKAQAAQFGLSSGSDHLPPQTQMISTDSEPATASRGRTLFGKGRVIDASEGTSLDPLLDKTYDLNTPKTVPSFKSDGPAAAAAN